MLRYALFITGVILSSIAAFYSVTGLAHIFASAFWPIVIMGATLELAKLVGASWIFRHWRTSPKPLVAYVGSGILVLMLLTGIGIFGYLSRSYLAQQAPMTQMVAAETTAARNVQLAKDAYARDEAALNAFVSRNTADQVIGRLSDNNRLSGTNGAVNVLRQQQTLQRELQAQLRTSGDALKDAETELARVRQQTQEQTVDVGPLMFVAKAWYGSTDVGILDHVVTVFILLIISVFDPMAIALLLAAQSLVPSQIRDVTQDNVSNTVPNVTSTLIDANADNVNNNVPQPPPAPAGPPVVTISIRKKGRKLELVPENVTPEQLEAIKQQIQIENPNEEVTIATDTSDIAEASLDNVQMEAERPKFKRAREHARS
jgi:hypothetical protein